jgi:hypothetical protein
MVKPKFACFACRKMFRFDALHYMHPDAKHREDRSVCPDCGAPMRNVGRHFRPPRRDDKKNWEAAELLYLSGHFYASEAVNYTRPAKGIATPGKALRFIEANPRRTTEGARLLAKYRKRTGK